MLKIGSHVSMSGKEMMLGAVKEALSYDATTFMFYTGAPQNTARKPVSQLRVEEAKALMAEHQVMTILVKGSRSAAMEEVVRALQENGTC